METARYTDQGYAHELTAIRERLLLMVGRVEEIILEAVSVLVDRDIPRAKKVVDLDHIINQDEMDLDAMCLEVLARRQPMASDLRFITLCMKMVTDLERIADLAVNIAERAIDLSQEPQLAPYIDIPRMGVCVRGMIREAMDAFVEGDADRARAVIERDDEVDDLYDRVFDHLLQLMRDDAGTIHRGIHIQSVAKFLERMADHSTNLAEQVIFMVEGTDVRHEGKLN